MIQQMLFDVEPQQLCPICSAVAIRHPGGIHQCPECSTAFTSRRSRVDFHATNDSNLTTPAHEKPPALADGGFPELIAREGIGGAFTDPKAVGAGCDDSAPKFSA